jgi:hypothetical protein
MNANCRSGEGQAAHLRSQGHPRVWGVICCLAEKASQKPIILLVGKAKGLRTRGSQCPDDSFGGLTHHMERQGGAFKDDFCGAAGLTRPLWDMVKPLASVPPVRAAR